MAAFDNILIDLTEAANRVGHHLVGAVPAVTINAGAERAAKGQSVVSYITGAPQEQDINPSMTIPDGSEETLGQRSITLSNAKHVPIWWTGESARRGSNYGFSDARVDQIYEAMNKLVRGAETYLYQQIASGSAYAAGVAGTTPFSTDVDEVVDVREALKAGGCPLNDDQLSLVLDSASSSALMKLDKLQQVNTSGDDMLLRVGSIGRLYNFTVRETLASLSQTSSGTSGATTTAAASAGATEVAVSAGGFVAGDVVSFAGHSTRYVVAENLAAAGNLKLNGRLIADVASGAAITVEGDHAIAGVALHRSAAELAFRPPAIPDGGDAAIDRTLVTDAMSGLTFEVALYPGYQKNLVHVSCVYGAGVWKPEFATILMG